MPNSTYSFRIFSFASRGLATGSWSACPLPRPEQQLESGAFGRMLKAPSRALRSRFIAQKSDIFPLQVAALLTSSPTTWYILQCGIHRIAGIYSAAPSTSRRAGRRGVAPDTRRFAQESREG